MKIEYKDKIEDQNIDINKLRPNNSYSYLIKNRNGSLQPILDNINEHAELLKHRNCPGCGENSYELVLNKFQFHHLLIGKQHQLNILN